PRARAGQQFGQCNRLRVRQVGARTGVWLNDKLVVDHAIMETFWDRTKSHIRRGPFQLQTHGGEIRWRNLFIREIGSDEANTILLRKDDAFKSVFNDKDFTGWQGDVASYQVVEGAIVCRPKMGGNVYTKDEYADFVARLEFKLPPGGNNGLAIRYPGKGQPYLDGMCEVQALDSEHPMYAKLDPRQY